MAESVLSVCWKDYTSELATVYKSLFENNFLVDCTVSAEGQSLKAHRLVLSACSPYFHKLFNEDTEKHPLIILSGASFTTLKAVIDFVYRGETHVPEGNLKAFLTLAQSLQIKGLNAFTKDYKNKSKNSIKNIPCGWAEDNQNTCEVENIDSDEDNPENYSQHSQFLDGYPDTTRTNVSIPSEGCSATCETEQSASAGEPCLEHHRSLGCDEVSVETDTTVKHEPLYPGRLETRHNNCPNTFTECYMDKGVSSNTTRNVPQGAFKGNQDTCEVQNINASHNPENYSQQCPLDLNGYPDAMHTNSSVPFEESSARLSMQEYRRSPRCDKVFIENEITVKHEPLYAEVSEKRNERLDNVDRDEPISGNVTSEINGGSASVFGEQDLKQYSNCSASSHGNTESSVVPPPQQQFLQFDHEASSGQDVATEPAVPSVFVPKSDQMDVEEREELRNDSNGLQNDTNEGAEPPRDEQNPNQFSRAGVGVGRRRGKRPGPGPARERPYECELCGTTFARTQHLNDHRRMHTGERPFRCDACGAAFAYQNSLVTHRRTHTGERPYVCEACGRAFAYQSSLITHRRKHTGERPYRCDACGAAFAHMSTLVTHRRRHTGERPYACARCAQRFSCAGRLARHARTHHPAPTPPI